MNIRCKLRLHGRTFASGGEFINLYYCPRCGRPDNNLCDQLLPIEQALWQMVNQQAGPEWDSLGKQGVVLRELQTFAGYDRDISVDAFYHDTWGYRASWVGNGMLSEALHVLTFRKVKPSERAEAAALRLVADHPLDQTTN